MGLSPTALFFRFSNLPSLKRRDDSALLIHGRRLNLVERSNRGCRISCAHSCLRCVARVGIYLINHFYIRNTRVKYFVNSLGAGTPTVNTEY